MTATRALWSSSPSSSSSSSSSLSLSDATFRQVIGKGENNGSGDSDNNGSNEPKAHMNEKEEQDEKILNLRGQSAGRTFPAIQGSNDVDDDDDTDHDDDDNSDTLQQQQQRRQHRRMEWNVANGEVSNDSEDTLRTRISIEGNYPVLYTCADFADTAWLLEQQSMSFQYEVWLSTRGNTSFQDNMRALEWSILWNVVKKLDLHRCDFDRQRDVVAAKSQPSEDNNNNNNRRRLQGTTTTTTTNTGKPSTLITALGSAGQDLVDITTASCSTKGQTDPGVPSICVPMTGIMTTVYTGDVVDVERTLTKLIQESMASPEIRVDDVLDVIYIGERPPSSVETVNVPESEGEQIGSQGGGIQLSGFGIGLLVTLAIVLVSLIVLLARQSRQRRAYYYDEHDSDRLEKSSLPMEITVAGDTHESDGGNQLGADSHPDDTQDLSKASTKSNGTPNVPATRAQRGKTQRLSPPPPIATTATGHSPTEHDGIMVDEPQVGSGSVYLASNRQHRKKKKRKKKLLSIRSKASMAPTGIETIHEGIVEDAGDDREFLSAGSYSSDEDSLERNFVEFESGWDDSLIEPASPPISPTARTTFSPDKQPTGVLPTHEAQSTRARMQVQHGLYDNATPPLVGRDGNNRHGSEAKMEDSVVANASDSKQDDNDDDDYNDDDYNDNDEDITRRWL